MGDCVNETYKGQTLVINLLYFILSSSAIPISVGDHCLFLSLVSPITSFGFLPSHLAVLSKIFYFGLPLPLFRSVFPIIIVFSKPFRLITWPNILITLIYIIPLICGWAVWILVFQPRDSGSTPGKNNIFF
jgi:hypothetical protein